MIGDIEIRGISERLGLTVVDCEEHDRAYRVGNYIYIGVFDDPELRLIAFFHELGHLQLAWSDEKYPSTLLYEIDCWNTGISIAQENEIIFTDRAVKWAYEQALTYAGHDEREFAAVAWKQQCMKFWISVSKDD